LELWL